MNSIKKSLAIFALFSLLSMSAFADVAIDECRVTGECVYINPYPFLTPEPTFIDSIIYGPTTVILLITINVYEFFGMTP